MKLASLVLGTSALAARARADDGHSVVDRLVAVQMRPPFAAADFNRCRLDGATRSPSNSSTGTSSNGARVDPPTSAEILAPRLLPWIEEPKKMTTAVARTA